MYFALRLGVGESQWISARSKDGLTKNDVRRFPPRRRTRAPSPRFETRPPLSCGAWEESGRRPLTNILAELLGVERPRGAQTARSKCSCRDSIPSRAYIKGKESDRML